MTKSSVHAILSELHKLVSSYRSADFVEASRYPGTPGFMKAALRAFAHEADSTSSKSSPEKTGFAPSTGRPNHSKVADAEDVRHQFLDALRRSPYFESTRSILAFANSIGQRIDAKPKEGRERLCQRLARAIEKLPQSKRDEIISGLFKGGSSQTQGWIDVIKSTNR